MERQSMNYLRWRFSRAEPGRDPGSVLANGHGQNKKSNLLLDKYEKYAT
jgi:hypothetical protein